MDETEQHIAWCALIPGYKCKSRNQKKNAKKRYLANLAPCANTHTKETAMDYNSAAINITASDSTNKTLEKERSYLHHRMGSIYTDKEEDLHRKFHLDDDPAPQTPSELLQRIKDGKVTFPTDEEYKKYWRYEPIWNSIRFRDPNVPEDKEGYSKAMSILGKEFALAKDIVSIQDPKDALVALQEWEKKELPN